MKRAAKIAFATVAVYVASYAPFSLAGHYDRGPRHFIGSVDWCPAGLTSPLERGRALTTLGYCYYPLLMLDRAAVHPSRHRC
jgi:hypothetical protein